MTQNVVYIRKVKKSESKSQPARVVLPYPDVVYIRKVKKSESKSQPDLATCFCYNSCVYP